MRVWKLFQASHLSLCVKNDKLFHVEWNKYFLNTHLSPAWSCTIEQCLHNHLSVCPNKLTRTHVHSICFLLKQRASFYTNELMHNSLRLRTIVPRFLHHCAFLFLSTGHYWKMELVKQFPPPAPPSFAPPSLSLRRNNNTSAVSLRSKHFPHTQPRKTTVAPETNTLLER